MSERPIYDRVINIVDQNFLIHKWVWVHDERRWYSPAAYLMSGNPRIRSTSYLNQLCERSA